MALRKENKRIGERWGKLTILKRVEDDKQGKPQWLCKCCRSCNRMKHVLTSEEFINNCCMIADEYRKGASNGTVQEVLSQQNGQDAACIWRNSVLLRTGQSSFRTDQQQADVDTGSCDTRNGVELKHIRNGSTYKNWENSVNAKPETASQYRAEPQSIEEGVETTGVYQHEHPAHKSVKI